MNKGWYVIWLGSILLGFMAPHLFGVGRVATVASALASLTLAGVGILYLD
jgi:hypothetical protein